MNDDELNELFSRVMATANRDTILLVGELHRRLSINKRNLCEHGYSIAHTTNGASWAERSLESICLGPEHL